MCVHLLFICFLPVQDKATLESCRNEGGPLRFPPLVEELLTVDDF